jgi:hypothetical protein
MLAEQVTVHSINLVGYYELIVLVSFAFGPGLVNYNL